MSAYTGGVKITLVERQPVQVAYLRYTGPFGEPLTRFWRATVAPWLADNGLMDCPRYGVVLDNPRDTPPERCRYDACVELPAGLRLPDAEETTIAGGRYAVTPFKGSSADIGKAWDQFLGAVVSDPANQLDMQRQPLEHHPRGASYDTRTGVFTCELCLPLTR
jgi:AraC family transcriptional regulator